MPRAKKSHADSGTSGMHGGASSSSTGGGAAAPGGGGAAATTAALSDEDLEALLESAPLSSAKNRASCATLLGHLKRHRAHWVFGEPVDTVALGLHDYYEVIKQPMDLGTIGKKLRGGSYMMVMDMVGRRRRRRRRWFYRSFRSSPRAIDESFLAVLLALLYSCPRLANSLIYLL